MSQANLAQQIKNDARVMEYALRGGAAYNSISKQPKPEGMSDPDFAGRVAEDLNTSKNAYEFLETAAFNVIAQEQDAKTRMSYIEKFTPAFPNSRFEEPVAQYAMFTLT